MRHSLALNLSIRWIATAVKNARSMWMMLPWLRARWDYFVPDLWMATRLGWELERIGDIECGKTPPNLEMNSHLTNYLMTKEKEREMKYNPRNLSRS